MERARDQIFLHREMCPVEHRVALIRSHLALCQKKTQISRRGGEQSLVDDRMEDVITTNILLYIGVVMEECWKGRWGLLAPLIKSWQLHVDGYKRAVSYLRH